MRHLDVYAVGNQRPGPARMAGADVRQTSSRLVLWGNPVAGVLNPLTGGAGIIGNRTADGQAPPVSPAPSSGGGSQVRPQGWTTEGVMVGTPSAVGGTIAVLNVAPADAGKAAQVPYQCRICGER